MTPEIRKMEEQVRQLQKDIEAAKNEYADANNPVKKVADLLHEIKCNWNHTDGCGWEYEKTTDYKKHGTTRNEYYVRAEKLLRGEPADAVIAILTKLVTA